MTTLVRGPIKLVTDRPDTVRKINLRAPELRLHGAGIVTDHNDDIPVVGGQVEFEALPGPAVLTLVTAGGAPLRSVDIVVPDEDTATLAECLDQIYTYDPPVVGRAQQFAREAGEHAARAEAGAARVGSAEQVGQWVGEAEVLHDDTVAAADRAETQAGVATEQAGVAAGHAEQAGEDRVQTGADRRQTGEDRAQTGEDREAAEGWAGQSKDAATLAITAAATTSQYVGDGFPEGKVDAPVGSIYTDRQATAGAIRWIKTQGTGNTGWKVEYGDTGWRDITHLSLGSLHPNNSGTVSIRRTHNCLQIWFIRAMLLDGRGTLTIFSLPPGWRPDARMATASITRSNSAATVHNVVASPSGEVWWISKQDIDRNDGVSIVREEDAISGLVSVPSTGWPTTLPDLIGDGGGGTDPDPADDPEESPAGSGLYTTTGIAENPANSGLFDIPTSLTPDPDNPGLYLIGD